MVAVVVEVVIDVVWHRGFCPQQKRLLRSEGTLEDLRSTGEGGIARGLLGC